MAKPHVEHENERLTVKDVGLKVDDIQDPQNPNADTLTQLKQYGGTGDGPLWHPSYGWDTIPGDTLHSLYNYDASLATFTDSGNARVALMDWEFSLDADVGQSIYITFYHDSDDDNVIFLDDIVVMQPAVSALKDQKEFYSKIYPNPAADEVTIEYFINKGNRGRIEILDLRGSLVERIDAGGNFGVQKVKVPISKLERGLYLVKLFNGDTELTEKLFVD